MHAPIRIPHLHLAVITSAVLLSLMSCSSGGSGNSGTSGGSGGSGSGGGSNSAPTISSISPKNATAGGASFTLTVNGSNFVSTSAISWNGTNLTTTGSSTALTATVPATDIAAVGAAQIAVVNPAASGGTSSSVGFIINGTPGFVYVANSAQGSVQTGSISAFSVDPNSGALSPVVGSPFPAGADPSSLTSDPGGKYLYESNDKNGATTNDLFAFAINPSTGALTPISGSPFSSGTNTLSVAVDPAGKFLFTADFGGDNNYPALPTSISEFSINSSNGALTLMTHVDACVATSSDVADFAIVDPAAGFLFASTDTSMCSYSMNSSGTLQPVAGSPFAVNPNGAGSPLDPRAVAVDPLGKFLYTADYVANGNVSAFSIASTGALTQLSGSPYSFGPANTPAASLVADPLDRFLWVDYFRLAVDGFSIDPNSGALSPIAGSLASPNPYIAITDAPTSSAIPMAADPSGKFLYVLTQPGPTAQNFTISGYAIDPTTGKLTLLPGSPLTLPANTAPGPVTITLKPQ